MFKGGLQLKEPFRATTVQFYNNCKEDFKNIFNTNSSKYVDQIKTIDSETNVNELSSELKPVEDNIKDVLRDIVDDIYKNFIPLLDTHKSYLLNQFLMAQQKISMEHLVCNIKESDIKEINNTLENEHDKLINDNDNDSDCNDSDSYNDNGCNDDQCSENACNEDGCNNMRNIHLRNILSSINENSDEHLIKTSLLNNGVNSSSNNSDCEDNDNENYNDFFQRFSNNIEQDLTQLLEEQMNMSELLNNPDNGSDNGSDNEFSQVVLETKTVKELKEICKKLNISQKHKGKNKNKETLIKDIITTYQSNE